MPIDNTSLLFLPDISGFTQFVKSTEIEHSQHIIAELLEVLIDQNEIDLQLAEIEGDALFYYKHKSVPTPDELVEQARRMYRAFHSHLKYYERDRICQCGACKTTEKLELKFIAHAGDFGFIKVKDSVKPYGEDVIKAHRLMKNKIDSDEYILVSDQLAEAWKGAEHTMPGELAWDRQSVETDGEEVGYLYGKIEDWKTNLSVAEAPLGIQNERLITIVREKIDAVTDDVFTFLSDFKYRNDINTSVDGIEYDPDEINRAGTKHVCVIGNTNIEFETIKRDFGDGTLVYGERTEKAPGFKHIDSYFLLQPDADKTNLEVRIYGRPASILSRLTQPLIARKLKQGLIEQLENLKKLAESSIAEV